MPEAKPAVSFDDDRIRVTNWTFEEGEDTGHHRHEFDYVVVPVTGGAFEITESDGSTRQMEQHPADSYLGKAGTEHNVTNRTGTTATFVEIELKR